MITLLENCFRAFYIMEVRIDDGCNGLRRQFTQTTQCLAHLFNRFARVNRNDSFGCLDEGLVR